MNDGVHVYEIVNAGGARGPEMVWVESDAKKPLAWLAAQDQGHVFLMGYRVQEVKVAE